MNKILKEQGIPLILTFVTFIIITAVFYVSIFIINLFPTSQKIIPELRIQDVTVGLIIYLKTAIDFAIFIGNLMRTNPGVKKRIAIEIGTALGNGAGTLLILIIWNFFRQVPLLMAIMIILAALILLRMSEESFEEFAHEANNTQVKKISRFINLQLNFINNIFKPLLGKLIPDLSITNIEVKRFLPLLLFSLTIPFILGLDDFAGYIPLFSIINVFGFATGVFLGHMLLNAALFVSPNTTTKLVRSPAILLMGGTAFVGIAAWGFYEAAHLITSILFH